MATSATTTESSTDSRTIDAARFARAATEPMAVEFTGPGIAEVEHDDAAYQVELGGAVCECADYQFRGERLVCKHVVRACLAALFDADQRVTEWGARVAATAAEHGCEHGVGGCEGPTLAGDRRTGGGLPCPGCCDSVRASTVDEWTVWQRLVGSRREAQ